MSEAYKLPPLPDQEPVKPKPNLKKVFDTSGSEQFKPGNKNKRVIAFILDGVISTVISTIVAALLVKTIFTQPETQGIAAIVIQMAVNSFYWIGCPYYYEGTPGKKMMGLRIVGNDYNTELTFKQLVMRESVGRLLSMIFMLGYVWCAINKEGKTWHDMISKTRVVDYK